MQRILLLCVLAVLCTGRLGAQCLSGVYTINSAQPTAGTNYQTFAAAVSALQNACGISGPVVFNVAAGSGPYNEQVIIPAITGASAVNTITFNGNGATLQATPVSSNRSIIRLNGADYIRINNLTLVSLSGTYGWGVHLTNGADRNKISGCTINMATTTTTTANNSGGVVMSGSNTSVATDGDANYDTISNNTIIGAYRGIAINGDNNSTNAVGNAVIGNTIQDFYANGIELSNTNGILVSGNNISRANRTGVTAFVGIELGADCINSLVIANRIHDTHNSATTQSGDAFGISLDGADAAITTRNRIINNQIYNFNSATGDQRGINSDGSNYATFLHNTIVLSHAASTSGVTQGIYQRLNVDSNIFKNNIVYITRGGSGAKHCIYFDNANSELASNYNDLYLNATNGNIGLHGSTSYGTLAAWQGANGGIYDLQSESLDPQFQSLATANLLPTNLLLDNKGAPLGVTTDFSGLPRSATAPDMGSLEFPLAPPTCSTPTGLTAGTITTTGASLSWTAVTGAIGYEFVVDQSSGNPAAAGTPITGTTHAATGLTPGATYYLHVRAQCSPTLFSSWATLSFATCPTAAITASGPLTSCQGAGLSLSANTGTGFTYQWKLDGSNISGATTASHVPAASGSYTVAVTFGGCTTTSAATAVTILPVPTATITAAGPTGFCQGGSVVLNANTGTGLTYQWKLGGTNISGATGASHTAATSGSYTVVVTNASGCAVTSAATTVTASAVPTSTVTASGALTFCQGSNVVLTAASGTGYTWQWHLNGTNISGATAAAYTASAAGSYSVNVTNGSCTVPSAASVVTVHALPPASVAAAGPVAFCDGAQVTLNANTGTGLTWQWKRDGINIPGATGNSHIATTTGSYAVTVTNVNNCQATATPVAVTVHANPAPAITYSSPLSFCEGSAVVLNTPAAGGNTVQWLLNNNPIPGATSSFYMAGQSGTYSVKATSAAGCNGTAAPVQVTVNPLPQPVITKNNLTLTTGTYAAYQWYRNGSPIAGAVGQSYTAAINGAYAVAVTDVNGCKNLSANTPINSLVVGEAAIAGSLKVYPNPANDIVTVEYTGKGRMTGISLHNMMGARILYAGTAGNTETIATSQLASGFYMIRIHTEGGDILRRLELVR